MLVDEDDVIYSSSPSEPGPSSVEQKRTGRKTKVVWNHFNTTKYNGKKITNKCKYCHQNISKQACKMEKHLSSCKKFKSLFSTKGESNKKLESSVEPVSVNYVPVAPEPSPRRKSQTKMHPFVSKMTMVGRSVD